MGQYRLRTAMNFQMRNNLSFGETFKRLYNEGGIARFYSGLPYALVSSPISRFGDTAANEGIKAYFEGTVRANLSISLPWSAWRHVRTCEVGWRKRRVVFGAATCVICI
jgi:hypothetical protein